MTLSKVEEGSKVTVLVEGWLDTAAAPELREYVAAIGEVDELVFDFDKVDYMASSGLREVVATFKAQTAAGKAFSVINVGAEVMSVFSLTKVDQKINVVAK